MNSLKKAMSGYGRTVIFSVIGILVVVVIGYRVMENRKKNEKTVSVMQSFDTSHREKVSADASPEYKDHLKEIDQKKEAEAIKSGKPFVANPLEAGDFTGNVCSPTTQGGVYMDAKGHLLVASVGGSGPLVDKNGIPIRDASGKQIIVPKGFYALVGPDGKPLLDAKGKPYIVSDKYRAVLGPDGKPLLGPDGKPILVPKGYHVAFGPDGKPLLGPDGKPIIVPNGYHVALGPDGKPLLGPDGKPIIVPDGSHVAICDGKPLLGPDGKPIIVKDGQSVKVGRGCRVLLGKNGAPVILDKDGQRVSAGTGSGTGGSRTDVNGDPLGAVNDALSYAHNSSGVAPSEEAMKASQKAFEDREKAMMGEMASISEAVFPSKPSSPPIQDYLPKKKATAKTVAAVPPQKKTMSVGKKYHIPDAILALLRPGRIYYGTIDGMVSSDVPGPVLATVQSGKLSGAKMLGKFKKSHNYLAIQFFSMTMPNGDVYPVTAYAVDASTEQDGLASNVDHHYWSRYGALLGGGVPVRVRAGRNVRRRRRNRDSVRNSGVRSQHIDGDFPNNDGTRTSGADVVATGNGRVQSPQHGDGRQGKGNRYSHHARRSSGQERQRHRISGYAQSRSRGPDRNSGATGATDATDLAGGTAGILPPSCGRPGRNVSRRSNRRDADDADDALA